MSEMPRDTEAGEPLLLTRSSAAFRAVAAVVPYDLYILVVSAISIIILGADSLFSLHPGVHDLLGYADTFLCLLFFVDFVRNIVRAPNKLGYFFRSGWLDLLSSVPAIGVLRLGRLVRIARIVRLMRAMRSVRTIGQIVSQHRAESALLAAGIVSLVMVLFGSIAVLEFEHDPESNIRTAGDAVWWAFATVTTVGYGDRYPVTLEGRIAAGMLMAAGVGLFGTLSGLVASWFLHPNVTEETDQIAALRFEVARLAAVIERTHEPTVVYANPSAVNTSPHQVS